MESNNKDPTTMMPTRKPLYYYLDHRTPELSRIRLMASPQEPPTTTARVGREDGAFAWKLSEKRSHQFNNRLVEHFGEYKTVPETDPSKVASYVENFLREILRDVEAKDPRFKGQLKTCDLPRESSLRINHVNDFVYIFELSKSVINIENFSIKFTNSQPRTQDELFWTSYFSLASEVQSKSHQVTLDPQKLLEEFQATVSSVCDMKVDTGTSTAAVTLYANLHRDVARALGFLTDHGKAKLNQHRNLPAYLLRITLYLGLPVERRNSASFWPLQGYGDVLLDKEATKRSLMINKCHLVAERGRWRVDFSRWQAQLIHQMTEHRGRRCCYMAYKNIRTHLGVQGTPQVDPVRTTQSFNMVFMEENSQHRDDKDWRPSALSVRARRMVRKLAQSDATPDVGPATEHSSTNSREAKKVLEFLDAISRNYHVHGGLHLLAVLSLFTAYLLLFLTSVVYAADDAIWSGGCTATDTLSTYLFALLPLAFLALVLGICGVIWVAVHRFLLKHSAVLYEMFRGLFYVYLVTAAESFLLAVFGIAEASLFRRERSCNVTSLRGLIITTAVLTGLTVLVFVVHVITYLAVVRGDVETYNWEFVFFDKIYERLCPGASRRQAESPRVTVLVNNKDPVRTSSEDYSEYDIDNDDRKRPIVRSTAASPRSEIPAITRQLSEPHLPKLGKPIYLKYTPAPNNYYSLQRLPRAQSQADVEPPISPTPWRPQMMIPERDPSSPPRMVQSSTLPRKQRLHVPPHPPITRNDIKPERIPLPPARGSVTEATPRRTINHREPLRSLDSEPDTPESPEDIRNSLWLPQLNVLRLQQNDAGSRPSQLDF